MAVNQTRGYCEYVGLSTDTKPTKVRIGSVFIELDTGKRFKFNGEWAEHYNLQIKQVETDLAQIAQEVNPIPKKVLDIPTFDDNPNTGHLSVVFVPNGISGYRYWMAHTPYPAESRELPSIVASNDKVNWVTPNGLMNPVVTAEELAAAGFSYSSDPNLVLLPDGKLALYYRNVGGSIGEALYRKVFSDGITWGEKTECVRKTTTIKELLSPSVVVEEDGTYTMFVVNLVVDDTQHIIQKRTSEDGLVWSAPVTIIVPNITIIPWHIEVQKIGGIYHMLISTRTNWRIYYFTSTDALNWIQVSEKPIIHLSGEAYDVDGHYKVAMIPTLGQPVAWDIWATGLNKNGQSNVYQLAAKWTTIYYSNVILKHGTFETVFDSKISKDDDSKLLILPKMFDVRAGAPTYTLQNTVQPSWVFASDQAKSIVTNLVIPKFWKGIRFVVWAFNLTGEAGNVRLYYYGNALVEGDVIGTNPHLIQAGRTFTLGTTIKGIQKFIFPDIQTVDTSSCLSFYLERQKSNGEDTFTGSLGIIGVQVERMA